MKLGIWKGEKLFEYVVDEKFQQSLKEGNTPLEQNSKLAKELGVEKIYLKREDKNPSGSHKDRYLAYSISAHLQEAVIKEKKKKLTFAISSSGNAAISATTYIQKCNSEIPISLHIFLSQKLGVNKLNRLITAIPEAKTSLITMQNFKNKNFEITFCKTPLSDSIKFAVQNDAILLRGSTDKYGIEGYKTISLEILRQLTELEQDTDSIFIPCSSGSTVAGIYEGFKKIYELKKTFKDKVLPKLFVLQTTEVNTISKKYDVTDTNIKNDKKGETSIAYAIVDKIAHRKSQIHKIIEATQGTAFSLTNKEIEKALEILNQNGIGTSPEGAMTIAGIIRAKKSGLKINTPVCIITGVK